MKVISDSCWLRDCCLLRQGRAKVYRQDMEGHLVGFRVVARPVTQSKLLLRREAQQLGHRWQKAAPTVCGHVRRVLQHLGKDLLHRLVDLLSAPRLPLAVEADGGSLPAQKSEGGLASHGGTDHGTPSPSPKSAELLSPASAGTVLGPSTATEAAERRQPSCSARTAVHASATWCPACPVTVPPLSCAARCDHAVTQQLEAHDLGAAYASLRQSKQMGLSHLRQRKAEGQPTRHKARMPASRAPSSNHNTR